MRKETKMVEILEILKDKQKHTIAEIRAFFTPTEEEIEFLINELRRYGQPIIGKNEVKITDNKDDIMNFYNELKVEERKLANQVKDLEKLGKTMAMISGGLYGFVATNGIVGPVTDPETEEEKNLKTDYNNLKIEENNLKIEENNLKIEDNIHNDLIIKDIKAQNLNNLNNKIQKRPKNKITDEVKKSILEVYLKEKIKQVDIAKKFNVHQSVVSNIILGHKKGLTYKEMSKTYREKEKNKTEINDNNHESRM